MGWVLNKWVVRDQEKLTKHLSEYANKRGPWASFSVERYCRIYSSKASRTGVYPICDKCPSQLACVGQYQEVLNRHE